MSKFLLLCLAALLALSPALARAGDRPYILYAQFVEPTNVDLSDGSRWAMDKGDCFPIYMFKDRQTKVVLQLGSATFMTEAKSVRVMKEAESPAALAIYRKNLESFLKAQADRWKREHREE